MNPSPDLSSFTFIHSFTLYDNHLINYNLDAINVWIVKVTFG